MQQMKKEDYKKLVRQKSRPSPVFKNTLRAFGVGGGICVLGQLLGELYAYLGAEEELKGTLVSISLIFISVVLTGLDIYDNVAKFAGAGTLVPITGFANSITSPAMEYKSEGLITGLGVKMFIVAGPVLVYGISASVIAGILTYLISLV